MAIHAIDAIDDLFYLIDFAINIQIHLNVLFLRYNNHIIVCGPVNSPCTLYVLSGTLYVLSVRLSLIYSIG